MVSIRRVSRIKSLEVTLRQPLESTKTRRRIGRWIGQHEVAALSGVEETFGFMSRALRLTMFLLAGRLANASHKRSPPLQTDPIPPEQRMSAHHQYSRSYRSRKN